MYLVTGYVYMYSVLRYPGYARTSIDVSIYNSLSPRCRGRTGKAYIIVRDKRASRPCHSAWPVMNSDSRVARLSLYLSSYFDKFSSADGPEARPRRRAKPGTPTNKFY